MGNERSAGREEGAGVLWRMGISNLYRKRLIRLEPLYTPDDRPGQNRGVRDDHRREERVRA